MVLVAGVIDTTSNYVEHPKLVAERLVGIANAIGDPTRVIAGTDCGFDTSAGIGDVAPSVVWEKLRALRTGADMASTRLSSPPPREREVMPPRLTASTSGDGRYVAPAARHRAVGVVYPHGCAEGGGEPPGLR